MIYYCQLTRDEPNMCAYAELIERNAGHTKPKAINVNYNQMH